MRFREAPGFGEHVDQLGARLQRVFTAGDRLPVSFRRFVDLALLREDARHPEIGGAARRILAKHLVEIHRRLTQPPGFHQRERERQTVLHAVGDRDRIAILLDGLLDAVLREELVSRLVILVGAVEALRMEKVVQNSRQQNRRHEHGQHAREQARLGARPDDLGFARAAHRIGGEDVGDGDGALQLPDIIAADDRAAP